MINDNLHSMLNKSFRRHKMLANQIEKLRVMLSKNDDKPEIDKLQKKIDKITDMYIETNQIYYQFLHEINQSLNFQLKFDENI